MMQTQNQRGFTLIETLVAITVIMTAIGGPLYAIQQTLRMSQNSRDQLVASSLAQEGVEFVRAIRDNNYLYILEFSESGRSWLYGLDGSGGSVNCLTSDCVVDPTQNTVSRSISPLYLSTTSLYNQSGSGTQTGFTRTVRLAPVAGSSTEIRVTVRVEWTNRGGPQNVTITDYLHNWL